MTNSYIISVIFIIAFGLIAYFYGSYMSGSDNTVLHPNRALTPHSEHSVRLFSKKDSTVSDIVESFETARTSNRQFSDSEHIIYAHGPSSVDIKRIDSTLFILDKENYILYEVDTHNRRVDTVARGGAGPGNISHARGLAVKDNSIYIGTFDFRIVNYQCDTDCSYSSTVNLNFAVKDLAVSNNRFHVMSYTAGDGFATDNKAITDTLSKFIQVLNMNGNTVDNYMDNYPAQSYLVRNKMTNGFINTFPKGKVTVTPKRFPYVYIFNNRKLSSVCKIPSFESQELKYFEKKRRYELNLKQNYSMIYRADKFTDSKLILSVKDITKDGSGNIEDISIRHFSIDISSEKCMTASGYNSNGGDGPVLILTSDHNITYMKGSLYGFMN